MIDITGLKQIEVRCDACGSLSALSTVERIQVRVVIICMYMKACEGSMTLAESNTKFLKMVGEL